MEFSIITCTYNSFNFLQNNIDSVKKQTFTDFEHIFVDGHSNDGTDALIEKYRNEFPNRVKYFSMDKNGISNAMNIGIKSASGKYLIFLNSDDSFFSNEVLSEAFNFLRNNDYDWIYGKINVVDEKKARIGIFPTKKIWQNNNDSCIGKFLLKFYNYIPHQSVFIKKSIFNKLGYFDESLSSAMDPDMWLRIYNKTKWSFCDFLVSNYSLRPNSETASIINRTKNKENYETVIKRHLNSAEYAVAKLIHFFLEKSNRNYR